MKRYLITSLLSLLVIGCTNLRDISLPDIHKIDVQQGNLITDGMIDTLRPGLTRKQVKYIMGTPLISDSFDNDRWDYVYQKRSSGSTLEHKQLSIYFSNDRLLRFE